MGWEVYEMGGGENSHNYFLGHQYTIHYCTVNLGS